MEQLIEKIAKAPLLVKVGGVAGAVVLVTVLNFFLFIQPAGEEKDSLKAQQQSELLKLAEKQEIAQNLNERRREMDLLEQRLSEALTELPETSDIEELLAQLSDIGKKSGLEISMVTPGKEIASTPFARIPIEMTVSGNYHEIAMFLQEVSLMRRIVNVNNLSLGTPTQRNEKVVLNSTFLATTFRFLDENSPSGKAP
jgi:type IV pilus assembly protein PilO